MGATLLGKLVWERLAPSMIRPSRNDLVGSERSLILWCQEIADIIVKMVPDLNPWRLRWVAKRARWCGSAGREAGRPASDRNFVKRVQARWYRSRVSGV